MSRRSRRSGDSQSMQQHLPFAQEPSEESTSEEHREASAQPIQPSHAISASYFSSSYSGKTPARSFFHQASHGLLEFPQYASQGVRDKTQELAQYALNADTLPSRDSARRFTISNPEEQSSSSPRTWADRSVHSDPRSSLDIDAEALPEPLPAQAFDRTRRQSQHSASGSMSRRNQATWKSSSIPRVSVEDTDEVDERRPLLSKDNKAPYNDGGTDFNHEGRLHSYQNLNLGLRNITTSVVERGRFTLKTLQNPETWSSRSMANYGLASAKTLSAVFLGTLLNVLDGLSYGLILFPLGHPIFANTGPDGISIFYVSCIVSQLVFSCGATVFKGGVGSEMIEVVPFFHKMTYAIMAHMGESDPPAVIATVITSYALSSILTGLIFLVLGLFKLGNLVNFFPRNILTGCIGGVGFFLFVTGIEVSARIDGSLEYNLQTLEKLFAGDTILLWIIPLILSVAILVIRGRFSSPLVMPLFFFSLTVVFYIFVKGIFREELDHARAAGWIFPKPESGVPFYRFYTYFKFDLVNWGAIAQTIPSMFALSFFGIIHVPINVPALGLAVREDNVNINRELIAHGLSNTISGCVGSIQNYLVYANSYLVYQNGGDNRLSGFLLAMATTAVWIAGPAMIGFIPVCVVGTLIFMLGIELLREAVWDTWGKLHRLEYLTIIVIVLIMGVYDFVVGIVTGIVLACLNYVVQTSRTPAIRAKYSGEIAESTVRRPPMDKRFLNQVGSQIRVEKLSGYLFFGTIVAVEAEIRALIDEESFLQRPIRYVIIDLEHVNGIDFSAAEAFQRMNRILRGRNVTMIISGVSFSDDVGKSLNMVGLFDSEKGDVGNPAPRVYEDLNNALEACENELIEVFHRHRLGIATPPEIKSQPISPPQLISPQNSPAAHTLQPAFASPRGNLLFQAAAHTIEQHGIVDVREEEGTLVRPQWKHFAQPTKIMLQTFEDYSLQNEDFWHRASRYFERRAMPKGTVLYSRGDEPDGFYLLESGRFRAEYDLEQGGLYEIILPGTTCGELPFFSETQRSGTVAAEQDSVAWLLTRDKFKELETNDPDIASELLKIGLKLTNERMNAITSYILVTAS